MATAPLASPFERAHRLRVGTVDAFVAEAGAGPDVVFIHGNPDSHDLWGGVVRRLAPGMRCIAPDLPGFGQSHAPRDFDCAVANQAAYVEGVLDGLGLGAVHLVVHDIGGVYGLAFATLHPERVRTLTIFNTSFFREFRWHFWGRVWRTPILGELSMLIANRWMFVSGMMRDSPAMPRAYADHAYDGFRQRETKRMILRWYRAMDFAEVMPAWDERMLAATRSIPRQVIWGMKDRYVPAVHGERFGAPIHRIEGHGHWSMAEAPDQVAPLIGALVASIPGT